MRHAASRHLPRILVATLLALVPAVSHAEDLRFDLINNSSITLAHLYASPVGEDAWGPDILGVDVLMPGETGTVTVKDGYDYCEYDMRFVAENGSEVTGSADLCTMASFTLGD
jgi:hypothetical protein